MRIVGSTDGNVVKIIYMILNIISSCIKRKLIQEGSISFFSRKNSLLKEEKERRNSLHLLSILINGLCNWDCCLDISFVMILNPKSGIKEQLLY